MTEGLYSKDFQVKRSNRLDELRQSLGEIADIIDETRKTMLEGSFKEATIGGMVIGAIASLKKDGDISRRGFFQKFAQYTGVGAAVGFFGGGVIYTSIREEHFDRYIRNELSQQYPGKEKAIIAYLELRYPPVQI